MYEVSPLPARPSSWQFIDQAGNEFTDVNDDVETRQHLLISLAPYISSCEEPQILQDFVLGFLPGHTTQNQSYVWLPAAIQLAHYGPDTDAATLSLRALSLLRTGTRWCDPRMIRRGQEAYGMALKTLQVSLYAPGEATIDIAIASCRFLACYEMFAWNGNASEPNLSWCIHQAGLEQLLRASGRQCMDGKLLHGTVDLAMRKAIATRRASDLTLPRGMSLDDQVWSHGLRYASLLAKLDTDREGSDMAGLFRKVMQLVRLDQQMQSWYLAMSLAEHVQTPQPSPQGLLTYRYKDLQSAQLLVVHWTLRILISRTISEACTSNPGLLAIASDPLSFSRLLKQYAMRQRGELALKVMRSTWFFADGDYRATGYIDFSFAYHHALESLLEDQQTVSENPWLKQLPLPLFTQKGVPIHGLPPRDAPPLFDLCVMDKYVKAYYGWSQWRALEQSLTTS